LKPQIPWLRVFVEGVVIVGSILLAFGVEAWWDGTGDATLRDAHLRGLAADFEMSEARLDTVMRYANVASEASSRWLQMGRSGGPSSDRVAVADTLLTLMLFGASYEPPTGNLEALISSGDLARLNNPQLVAELGAWSGIVRRFSVQTEKVERNATEVTLYLRETGVRKADSMWYPDGFDYLDDYPIQPQHTDGYLLFPDPEWETIVSDRWWAYKDVSDAEKRVRGALERIRALLDEELSGGT
jgi:hypothetical protein